MWMKYLTVSCIIQLLTKLSTSNPTCSTTEQYYSEIMLGRPNLETMESSRVCSNSGVNCCTPEMEANMADYTRTLYGKMLAAETEEARGSMMTATAQFNDFFLKLLKDGQDGLHVMFSTAYGVQYRQNEHVFRQLFAHFEKYYKDGNVNLVNVIQKFFEEVFVKMFAMLNPEHARDNRYLKCVRDSMQDLKPFKDTPEYLERNLRQALVAARTFVQGLVVGRNTVRILSQVEPTRVCQNALTAMSVCPTCESLGPVKFCKNYCLNVMKGCLSYHAELDTAWKQYIAAMEELSQRLVGSGAFNIEYVMAPLKDQISEAIMEYQGASPAISERLKERCTDNGLRMRSKRDTKEKKKTRQLQTASSITSLSSLTSDIQTRLSEMKELWISLPFKMCDKLKTSHSDCWNGRNIGRYDKELIGNGVISNQQNPEMSVSADDADDVIKTQIDSLIAATNHLSNAKLGMDVDWLDLNLSNIAMKVDNKADEDNKPITPKNPKTEKTEETTVGSTETKLNAPVDNFEGSGDVDTEGSGDMDELAKINYPKSEWETNNNHYLPVDNEEEKSKNRESLVVISPYTTKNPPTIKKDRNKNTDNVHNNNNNNNGDNEEDGEGSGVYLDSKNDFIMPIKTSPVDNKHKYTYEGSGGDSDDDEDLYMAKNPENQPGGQDGGQLGDSRIVNSNSYNDIQSQTTARPRNTASSFSYNLILSIIPALLQLICR